MTLISYISIPIMTPQGVQYFKFDIFTNQILFKDKEIVNLNEIFNDIHHIDDETDSDEIDIHSETINMLTKELMVIDITQDEYIKELTTTLDSIKELKELTVVDIVQDQYIKELEITLESIKDLPKINLN